MNLKQIISLVILFMIVVLVVNNKAEEKPTISSYTSKNEKEEYEVFSPNSVDAVSLQKNWDLELDDELMIYTTEENTLYVLSRNNTVYSINFEDGSLLSSFTLNESISGDCRHMSVSNGILALNYESNIVVFDTVNQKVVWNYIATKLPLVRVGSTAISDNVLMFWDTERDGIVAKDIFTHEELWFIGGQREEHGVLNISQYYNRCFIKYIDDKIIEINPKTREIVKEYTPVYKGEYKNDLLDSNHYVLNETTSSIELDQIFNRQFLGLFRATNTGRVFSVYNEVLHYHGFDYSVEWKAVFDSEIRSTYGWKNYVFISTKKDKLLIFDLNRKEIVYEMKLRLSGRPYFIQYGNQIIFSDNRGNLVSYDLNKLTN